jgi:hypothetical protein
MSCLLALMLRLDGQQGGDAAIGGGGSWEASPDNWIYGGVAGGDASKGSIAGDQQPIEPIMKYNPMPATAFLTANGGPIMKVFHVANNTIKSIMSY